MSVRRCSTASLLIALLAGLGASAVGPTSGEFPRVAAACPAGSECPTDTHWGAAPENDEEDTHW